MRPGASSRAGKRGVHSSLGATRYGSHIRHGHSCKFNADRGTTFGELSMHAASWTAAPATRPRSATWQSPFVGRSEKLRGPQRQAPPPADAIRSITVTAVADGPSGLKRRSSVIDDAWSNTPRPKPVNVKALFEKLDINRDGVLQFEEAKAALQGKA